jgi:hypothetical protein
MEIPLLRLSMFGRAGSIEEITEEKGKIAEKRKENH